MSYLLRIQIPDQPGVLGHLAQAFGDIQGNINSVDIVSSFDGIVVDDIVVSIPNDTLPDALFSALSDLEGVEILSLRPFSGTLNRQEQIALLAQISRSHGTIDQRISEAVDVLPDTMAASWAIILKSQDGQTRRLTGSSAAPLDNDTVLSSPPVGQARALDVDSPEDQWVPENWAVMDSGLAAVPIRGTGLTLVVGRSGGPDFLEPEITHLAHLGDLLGKILK